ncbi:hypothetical protein AAEU32_06730 [Pseudoalteromonas sp. SSDWG2]|uniref:hypothetical protein n=1 Tax=Pseudoalteromonas sp. SSDWG2 TaxID=3139391 RepID=UPI003BACF331
MRKCNMKYTLLFLFSLFAFTGLVASTHLFANAPVAADQYTLTIEVDSSQYANQEADDDNDPEHPISNSTLRQSHGYQQPSTEPSDVPVAQAIRVAHQRAPPYFS